MKKKAVVTIKSNASEDADDIIEVVSVGEFEVIDNGFKVEYDETEVSGMEGTKTIMLINNDSFSLIREGTTEAKMEFIKNKENIVFYKTPYGIMNLRTFTKELEIDFDNSGGSIKTLYTLLLEEEQVVNTNLMVSVAVDNS